MAWAALILSNRHPLMQSAPPAACVAMVDYGRLVISHVLLNRDEALSRHRPNHVTVADAGLPA